MCLKMFQYEKYFLYLFFKYLLSLKFAPRNYGHKILSQHTHAKIGFSFLKGDFASFESFSVL